MNRKHKIERVRHELIGRTVTVVDVEQLTPKMRRVHFESPSLDGFYSPAPDDHIALFFSSLDGEEHKRHYTPRSFDPEKRRLAVDFFVHEGGPATEWAEGARPGEVLDIGGPRSSLIVSDDFDWYLLIGDETAIPAIARRVESLGEGVRVVTIIAVHDSTEIQHFSTRAAWQALWCKRGVPTEEDAARLQTIAASVPKLDGDGFIWIGGEVSVARRLRAYFVERGHPPDWMHVAGYWRLGTAAVHEVIDN